MFNYIWVVDKNAHLLLALILFSYKSYNPGQNFWDTNAIARQIEASSLPPSPSVQCWSYVFKF